VSAANALLGGAGLGMLCCMDVLRRNSPIRAVLEQPGIEFLEWAAGAFERILPHAEITGWRETAWRRTESVWDSSDRDAIRVTIPLGPRDSEAPRSIQTRVRRRSVRGPNAQGRVLDSREWDICRRISQRVSQVLSGRPTDGGAASLSAIRDAHHGLRQDMTAVLDRDEQRAVPFLLSGSERSFPRKYVGLRSIAPECAHPTVRW
jgi:hypothetical protein